MSISDVDFFCRKEEARGKTWGEATRTSTGNMGHLPPTFVVRLCVWVGSVDMPRCIRVGIPGNGSSSVRSLCRVVKQEKEKVPKKALMKCKNHHSARHLSVDE